MDYYNEVRTHLSLNKDAPVSRSVQRAGHILRHPILGGLHHQYVRVDLRQAQAMPKACDALKRAYQLRSQYLLCRRKTLSVSRPREVVALNCWVTGTNDTP